MANPEEQELEENLSKQSNSILKLLSDEKCKLSVLITGGSQNGKSSMIKFIFGEEAAVGSNGKKIAIGLDGKPATQNVTSYVNPKGNLELIDTPGLEKNVTINRISQIQKELKQNKFQPSIVWIILNYQASMEDVELELAELVPDAPVIFIVNKCDFLHKKRKEIQDYPQCLEHFDKLSENDLPEWMKKKPKLIAIRKRLLDWKNKHERVRRIVITSLGSGEDDDEDESPIGLETVLEATSSCLDQVGRVLLAELQQNTKINKIKGSIAIVLASATLAADAGWIPLPIFDWFAISSIQITMVTSLYKYWSVLDIDVKTFVVTFLKNLAPVLVSCVGGHATADVAKFFFGLGSIFGGAFSSVIGFIGTIVIGVAVTAYLSQSVYQRHQDNSKEALEKNIQDFMKSSRVDKLVSDIKNLAKNPKQITNNTIVSILVEKV